MKILAAFLAAIFLLACNSPEPTEVLVLPSLHGAHEVNKNYTYEDLMQIIKAYNPEVIGVEIRPVDMKMNSDSLDVFYPVEMIRVRDSFPGKVKGIDHYNVETMKIPVSRKIFTDSTTELGRIRNLMSSMQQDSLFLSRYEAAGISKIQEAQKRIALTYSAGDFLKGEYDSLTQRQYRLEDSLFRNTPYEAYTRFNDNRDLQITKNALELVNTNPSKRVLILVGANHRNRLVDSLQSKDPKKIELISDLNFLKAE